MPKAPKSTSPPLTVAEKINLLFETVRRPDGKNYTEREVSEGTDITHKTLNHIRNGRTPNPGISTVQAIARFFEVSLAYFDAETSEECYQYLMEKRMKDQPPSKSANEIMFRSLGVSEEARRDILKVLQWVEAAEQQKKATSQTTSSPAFSENHHATQEDPALKSETGDQQPEL